MLNWLHDSSIKIYRKARTLFGLLIHIDALTLHNHGIVSLKKRQHQAQSNAVATYLEAFMYKLVTQSKFGMFLTKCNQSTAF